MDPPTCHAAMAASAAALAPGFVVRRGPESASPVRNAASMQLNHERGDAVHGAAYRRARRSVSLVTRVQAQSIASIASYSTAVAPTARASVLRRAVSNVQAFRRIDAEARTCRAVDRRIRL